MRPRDSIILSRRFGIIILSPNVGKPLSNDAASHARITDTSDCHLQTMDKLRTPHLGESFESRNCTGYLPNPGYQCARALDEGDEA